MADSRQQPETPRAAGAGTAAPTPPPGTPAPLVVKLADLASRAGEVLGRSSWHEVTQEEVTAFAHLTGDEQWIHVDPRRASAGPFGGTIAHGYFTLSLATVVLDEVLSVSAAGLVLNYGANRVRFPTPVPVGSRLRGLVEVAAVAEIEGGIQAVFRITFEIEGATKPGCVAEIVYRYYSAFPGAQSQREA